MSARKSYPNTDILTGQFQTVIQMRQGGSFSPWRAALRMLLRIPVRYCPTYRGGIRIAESRLARGLTRQTEWVTTRAWGGLMLRVNIADYDGRALYFWGANDRKVNWLCAALLRKGDVMLDIGANYGAVGLLAARVVGSKGRVHCFEPQPELADAIVYSAQINGLRNLTVHQLALSDRDGTAPLSIPPDHSGRARIELEEPHGNSLSVPLCHSGKFFENLDLDEVRLIKLDVEGHENAVLSGAVDFFQTTRLPLIVFESHDHGRPRSQREPIPLLLSLGYRVFQIRQRSLFRVQLKAIERPDDIETGYDFLACSRTLAQGELCRLGAVV